MCKECEDNKTKVCKICGEEKSVEEFPKSGSKNGLQLYKCNCRVCDWFNRRSDLVIQENWNLEHYRIIIDNLVNEKVDCINDIVPLLFNKTLEDLIKLLAILKLKTINVKLKYECEYCKKEIYTPLGAYLKNEHHFCSKECYNNWQYNSIIVACDYCGKDVEVETAKLENNQHIFCCYEHSTLYKIENTHKIRNCQYCNKEFSCLQSSLQKFCSRECVDNWQREHPITNRKSTNIILTCDNCEKEYSIAKSKFKKTNHHFCSRDCKIKFGQKQTQYNTIKFNCDKCGKESEATKYKYNKGKNHFCSKECADLYKKSDNGCLEGYSKCNICKEIKSTGEFLIQKRKNGTDSFLTCKVCGFFNRRKNIIIKDGWTIKEYNIIVDNLLNKKVNCINDIIPKLDNKKLEDLVSLLNNELKINTTYIRIKQQCPTCDIDVFLTIGTYLNKHMNFCSSECQGIYHGKIRSKNKPVFKCICSNCGIEYYIGLSRHNAGKDKFCSPECSQENQNNKIKIKCATCGEDYEFSISQYNRSKVHFCSHECANIFYNIKEEIKSKKCEICGKEFVYDKSKNYERFCSKECHNQWNEMYYYPNKDKFNFITTKCGFCNTSFEEESRFYNTARSHFCCEDCKDNWVKNFYASEENKNRCRIVAVRNLESGLISTTNSKPQIIVNRILKNFDIKYENEFNCKYYAIDNYLTDYNLMIECMGTYFHADNREYSIIKYKMQRDRIYKDKQKRTYIKNKYDINILYLWEYDIKNNIKLCEYLIKNYVQNKGVLVDYHSFNYSLDSDENLILNKDMIIPYMNWDNKDLSKIINIPIK